MTAVHVNVDNFVRAATDRMFVSFVATAPGSSRRSTRPDSR